ncbi:MAG: nucleotidyl transferase AbiEii/AbiGii toxin family protein [Pirellulales bacterium]
MTSPTSPHWETISDAQRDAMVRLGPLVTRCQMYLAGGTSVALQLGHRRSIDLDWFSLLPISDPMVLAQELKDAEVPFETRSVDRGTLHGQVLGVRVSFIEYRYPLLRPPFTWPEMGCPLASLLDLAGMKLVAVAQRGAKKDFLDVYALGMKAYSLADMLGAYRQKYDLQDISRVLYSLTYFDDADREPMPTLLWDSTWEACKAAIRTSVQQVTG